jgi:opacity protein-like surface antigen
MKKLCVLALSLIALPVLADNNQGFYLGAGASSLKDYQDGLDNVSRIRSVELLGGYKYNNALGIELRLGSGKTTGTSTSYVDDDGVVQSGSLERELGSYQSIYYRPELVNDEAKLYALLGYTHVNSSGKTMDSNGVLVRSVHDSESGYSYGLGIGFVINEHFNINIEYKNICEEISNKPNFASVNVDYRF